MRIALLIVLLALRAMAGPVPRIAYSQSYSTYSYAAYPNDSCSKLMLTSNFIFRLGANNVVSAVNKTSLATRANLLNYTYSLSANGTLTTPALILDFDVDRAQSCITVAQTTATRILNLMKFTLKLQLSTSPFYKVLFNSQILTGALRSNASLNDYFYQKKLSAAQLMASSMVVLTPNSLPNVKNCQAKESPDRNIHVYWDQYSNVFVFNFTNKALTPVYLGRVASSCTVPNLTQAISFSSDSQYFIIQADSQLPVQIVSLMPESLLSVKHLPFNGVINKAMFLDTSNAFIALFNDTATTVFQLPSMSLLYSLPFFAENHHIEVDYSNGQIYVCRSNTVDVYNSEVTLVDCSSNCQTCVDPNACQVCLANYTLINNTCVLVQQDENSTNSTNSNSTDSTNSSVDSSANGAEAKSSADGFSSSNSTNSKWMDANETSLNASFLNSSEEGHMFLILIMPDGSVVIFQLTLLEQQIINATKKALKISNNALEQVMVALSSSPLIYLVLGNLQFFTISSLYALLNVPIPEIIYNTLQTTAASLSCNLFTALKANLAVPVLGVERVSSQKRIQFGVSTLFLPNNYQYFLLAGLAILLLFGMRVTLSIFKSSKFLFLLLDHNKHDVIFGLILSGMTQMVLPYSDVYQNPYSISFSDKINQSIQFLLLGVVLLVGALYVTLLANAYSAMRPRSTSGKGAGVLRAKQRQLYFINWRKQRDNIYLIFLNLFFPMLVVLSESWFFLLVNQALLIVGVYLANLSTKFRTNRIILSLYPILFHICFIIFKCSQNSSTLIITQIACIIVYFIGSAHELLTILFSFLHFLYRLARIKTGESKVQPEEVGQAETPSESYHQQIMHVATTAVPLNKVRIDSPSPFTFRRRKGNEGLIMARVESMNGEKSILNRQGKDQGGGLKNRKVVLQPKLSRRIYRK